MATPEKDWFIETDFELPRVFGEVFIYGGDGELVAGVCSNMGLGIPAIERALRIIRAVNLFDELVEALEAYQKANRIHNGSEAELFYKAATVIAKAKEPTP